MQTNAGLDEKLENSKRRCIARVLAVNDQLQDAKERAAMRAIVMASVNSFVSEVKGAIDDFQTEQAT
jgi:hypothetical protein